jgi:hypothetical protein
MRDKTEHLIHNLDGEIASSNGYATDHTSPLEPAS